MRHLIFLLLAGICSSGPLFAQNYGFEAPAATPPAGWSAVTGTWSTINSATNPTGVRSGKQAMSITDPATTGTTMGNTVPTVTTPSAGFWLVTMCWGRDTNNNGRVNLGFRSGSTNTLNPSSTSTGQAPNLSNTGFVRVISVSNNTVAAGSYSPALRAFRSTSTTGTTLFLDDFIIYASTTNVPDTIAPAAVSGLSAIPGVGYDLTWTPGTDLGPDSSGIGGAVILRTEIVGATAPVLNPQAMYSPLGGAAGIDTVVQGGITWRVIGSLSGNPNSFTDSSANSSISYTYAVIARDLAFNYSTATVASTSGPINMAYSSSNTVQILGIVFPGDFNRAIIRVPVVVSGTLNPLSLTQFNFSTAGSTSAANISRARVYFTGNSTLFDTSNQFGSAVINPSGSFSVTGSQTLTPGTNIFWLNYDISPSAIPNQVVDAECNGLVLGGNTFVPTTTGPAGNRQIKAALNGIYTVGGTNPNYDSIDQVINDLNNLGITGPVTFNFRPGSYTGAFTLNPVIGSSAVNTITFASENGDSSLVFITNAASTSATNNFTLFINGADNLRFNRLTLERSGTTQANSRIIELNGSDNVQFANCRFLAQAGPLSADASGVRACIFSSDAQNENNLEIRNCSFSGNGSSVWLNGSTGTTKASGLIIENCTMNNFYTGVFALHQSNPIIRNNIINRNNTTSTLDYFGISLRFVVNGFTIERNQVNAENGFNGIRVRDARGTLANRATIINNTVKVGGTAASNSRGISLEDSSQFVEVAYNSAWITVVNTANARVFNVIGTNALGINIYNNSFVNTGQGFAYFIGDASVTGIDSSNNNNIWSNGTNIAYWTSNHTTLSSLRIASGRDNLSVSGDPAYGGTAMFTPQNASLNGLAKALPGITTDVFGNSRSTTNPDIGAVEYIPVSNDLALLSVIGLPFRSCTSSSVNIRMVVRNLGSSPVTTFTATATLAGPAPVSLSNTFNLNLGPAAIDTVTLGILNFTTAGNYTAAYSVSLSGDGNAANDTLSGATTAVQKQNNPTLITTNPQVCPGTPALLIADGSQSIQWFSNSALTQSLASGDTLLTAPINSATTFYFANDIGQTVKMGLPAILGSGTSGAGTTNFGLVFDVLAPCRLNSVLLHPVGTAGASGSLTIDVIDGNSNIIHTATVTVQTNPIASVIPQRVNLNFNLLPGTNYKLRPRQFVSPVTGLVFNPSASAPVGGNYGYPFVFPGNLIIQTSTLTAAPTNTARNDLYYYFYDWEVSNSSGCPGVDSVTVNNASVPPVPAFTFSVNQSTVSFFNATSGGSTYSWDFGNSIGTSTAVNPVYNYPAIGSYLVTLQASNSCGGPVVSIANVNILVLGSDQELNAALDFEVYPVPVNIELFVKFPTQKAQATLQILDMQGKAVQVKQLYPGEELVQLRVDSLPSGIYLVQMIANGKTLRRRIVIE